MRDLSPPVNNAICLIPFSLSIPCKYTHTDKKRFCRILYMNLCCRGGTRHKRCRVAASPGGSLWLAVEDAGCAPCHSRFSRRGFPTSIINKISVSIPHVQVCVPLVIFSESHCRCQRAWTSLEPPVVRGRLRGRARRGHSLLGGGHRLSCRWWKSAAAHPHPFVFPVAC